MNGEQELIDRHLDGELNAEEETRLADWLAANREHIRAFVREAHLHRQLRDIMLAQPFHAEAGAPVERTERTTLLSTFDAVVLLFRRSWLPLTASLALAIGAGIWFFAPTMGQPSLAEVQGDGVSVLRAGRRLPIVAGMRLESGDVLRTSTRGTAIIGFQPEATTVTLQPNTDVKLAAMSRGKHFDLRAGKLEASVARQRPFFSMMLATPQAEARVVGTRFTLLVTNNATRLAVTEGKVRLRRLKDGAAEKVGAGRYAVVGDQTELSALPFTGAILREWWSGVAGRTAANLRDNPRFPNRPDAQDLARTLELEPVKTNQLGVRFCGYVHPPVTGDYEFWLAGATDAILFMSPDENPAAEVPIARTRDNSRNLDQPRFMGPTSWAPPVPLVAGRRYYIEALVFIEKGEGHLAVAWKRPGEPREPLTGEYLSPYKPK